MHSIVVLGHKDHGKSTFLGRLLHETNSVPQDKVATVKEIDAEAGRPFEWAHLLDAFKEEREQNMTYDTASVFVKGARDTYVFIDVPGHEELVHQMLSGASRAEAAMLVVSAQEGIDVMTIKHAALVKLLGIKDLMVAVNKMDAVGYEERAFRTLAKSVTEALSRAGGFDESRIVYFPIAAVAGDNVARRSPRMPWYSGPAVFEHIERLEFDGGARPLPFRLLIQDVYAGEEPENAREIAVGNVKSGFLRSDKELLALPSGEHVRISKLFSSSGEARTEARSGENVSVIFADQESGGPKAGSVLSYPEDSPRLTKSVKTKNFFFRGADAGDVLMVECGRMAGTFEVPHDIRAGEIIELRLSLGAPVLFDAAPTFLNKFIFKSDGEIIGVGAVESF